MSTLLKLNAGTLATNCWTSPQELYNEMFARGSALLGDITGIIISASAPAPNDRDKAWIKTNAGAPVSPYPYIWFNGKWVSPHPYPKAGDLRLLWVGIAADLDTFDGGDTNPAGDASGPMWVIDHDFDARWLVGPGTTVNGTVVAADTNVGSDQLTVAQTNLPNINFQAPIKAAQANGLDTDTMEVLCNPTSAYNDYTLNIPSGGSGTPLTNVPQSRGIYVIRRSDQRMYYVG